MGADISMSAQKNSIFSKKIRISAMIKKAVDNLPSGICFFDERGIPVLVNRTMHRLIFALTGRDLPDISDLDRIMEAPEEVRLNDGSIWRFQKRPVSEESGLTEIIASDITELSNRKRELEDSNREQRELTRRIEEISKNVISIMRNEEILEMKMKIHSDLGYALSATRHFITSGCPDGEAANYIAKQREMALKLLDETENDDEPDIFSELKRSAGRLGMEIVCEGEIPDFMEAVLTKAVRECLVNTVRHGGGNTVYVSIDREGNSYTAIIKNNGKQPLTETVKEGGGLSSLRKSIEESGGTMKVEVKPEFAVKILYRDPEAMQNEDILQKD